MAEGELSCLLKFESFGQVLVDVHIDHEGTERCEEISEIQEVLLGEILLPVVDLPKHSHDDDERCHPAEDRPGHKKHTEDARVPSHSQGH